MDSYHQIYNEVLNQMVDRYIFFTTVKNFKRIGSVDLILFQFKLANKYSTT